MYPNVFGCIQMYSDVSKFQISSDVSKCVQNSKCVHIYPNESECIQMYPSFSNVCVIFKCTYVSFSNMFCESVTKRCNLDFCAKSKIIPKSP